MTAPTIPVEYISAAADEYERSLDPEYNLCRDNGYRWFLINEYANWLWTITEKLDIFEDNDY